MTPEEEIQIEAEARARARMRVQQSQATPAPQLEGLVAQPFTGKTPSSTEDTSLWGKALNWVANQSMVPPVGDERGQLVYPKASVQDVANTKELAKQGATLVAEGAGYALLPELLPLKAGPAVDLVGRGAQYALQAGESALGGYLAKKGTQAVGLSAPTTGQQDWEQATQDVAIGAGLPLALDAAGTGIKAAGDLIGLNSDARIAKQFGASPSQMAIGENQKPIQENVAWLRENSPEFVQNQIANPNIRNAAELAVARVQEVGGKIRDIYANNSGLVADISDVSQNPAYMKLVQAANNPARAPDVLVDLQAATKQINIPLQNIAKANGGKLPLGDLWEVRKDIDTLITKFNSAHPDAVDKGLLLARTTLQDVINSTIQKVGNPQVAKELQALNQEYSNLHDVAFALGKKYGKVVGDGILDSSIPLTSLKGATGNYLGLASNAGRATIYNAGQGAPESLAKLTTTLSGVSSLLPRDTKAIHANTDHTNTVIDLARQSGMILTADEYSRMPTPMKNMVIGELSKMSPQSFEVPADNISIMDGKFQNPVDKDAVVQQSLDLEPQERAFRVGAAFQNKYIPEKQDAPPPRPVPALPLTMDKLNNALSIREEPNAIPTFQSSPDQMRMLEELTASKILHERDIQ